MTSTGQPTRFCDSWTGRGDMATLDFAVQRLERIAQRISNLGPPNKARNPRGDSSLSISQAVSIRPGAVQDARKPGGDEA